MTADTDQEDVVVETDLDAPPEKVWRALTEPAIVAEWLAPEAVPAQTEVLEAEPPHELRIAWRGPESRPDAPPSEVAFTLTPTEGGGTFLRIVHSGLPARVLDVPANDDALVMRMAA